MKCLATLLVGFALSGILRAQLQPPIASEAHRGLSLDAAVISSGGVSRSITGQPISGATTYGQGEENFLSTRDKQSSLGLKIEVRNLAAHPDRAKLEWYFFCKPAEGRPGVGRESVFDIGSQDVALDSSSSQEIPVQSQGLSMREERNLKLFNPAAANPSVPTPIGGNKPSASSKKTGSKISGWIVRLVAGDQVLAVKASSPALESLARDALQLQNVPRQTVSPIASPNGRPPIR